MDRADLVAARTPSRFVDVCAHASRDVAAALDCARVTAHSRDVEHAPMAIGWVRRSNGRPTRLWRWRSARQTRTASRRSVGWLGRSEASSLGPLHSIPMIPPWSMPANVGFDAGPDFGLEARHGRVGRGRHDADGVDGLAQARCPRVVARPNTQTRLVPGAGASWPTRRTAPAARRRHLCRALPSPRLCNTVTEFAPLASRGPPQIDTPASSIHERTTAVDSSSRWRCSSTSLRCP